MAGSKRLTVVILTLFAASLLSGCGLIEIIAEGFARVCETDPLVVTKTADTNDSLCTGDDCSLREAVVTANNCPGHQTIQVPGGTYLFTRAGADEDAADTGDLDITETVTIEGELGATVLVDADGVDRVFHILPSAGEVSLSGVTVQGGLIELPTGWARGGGILNEAELNLHEAALVGNRVAGTGSTTFISSGGGLYNGNTATLVNVEVRDNVSESPSGGNGGGILNDGEITLSEVRFESNRANNQGGGFNNTELGTAQAGNTSFVRNRADKGGGLTNNGQLMLERVAFSENHADTLGGGIYNQFDQLDGRMVALEGNAAGSSGGGLYNWDPGTVNLRQSAFSGNESGGFGAALYNSGQFALQQGSMTDNSAADGPGAIYQSEATAMLELINVTISGNRSQTGYAAVFSIPGGLRIASSTIAHNPNFGLMTNSDATLFNTIVSDNGEGDCDPSASTVSGGHNLIGDDSCAFSAAGDLTGDPLLQPLTSDGWVGQVHPLAAGSPAIDVGIGAADCPAEDQRAVARPQGSACDIGAFELEAGAGGGGAGEATATPGAAATATTAPLGPISINFNADAYTIEQGQCTTLRWSVENADRVYFEGQEMPATEAEQVCPSQTSSYGLTAENEQEEQTAQVTIEVTLAPPAAPTNFQVTGNQCSDQSYQVFLSWNDASDNEEGFRLYREGQLIATLGAGAESYTDEPPYGGPYTYELEAFNASGSSNRVSAEEKGCIY